MQSIVYIDLVSYDLTKLFHFSSFFWYILCYVLYRNHKKRVLFFPFTYFSCFIILARTLMQVFIGEVQGTSLLCF